MPLRHLPTTLTRDGFLFTQVFRDGVIAVYEQRRPDVDHPVGFEVIRIRVGKAHPKDADQSPKERYPSSEEWGKFGWSYINRLDAMKQAAHLLGRIPS